MNSPPDIPDWLQAFRAWLAAAGPPAGHGGSPPPTRRQLPVADVELLPFLLCRLARPLAGPAVVAVADTAAAERLAAALQGWLELAGTPRPVRLLPPAGQTTRRQWIPENDAARAAALDAARAGEPALFIAAAAALLDPVPPPGEFADRLFELRPGDRGWSPEALAARLTAMDYDNEPEVRVPGEFARRGGILDLFSPAHPDPVRVEFFGDTIESLRFFSAETQRSLRSTDRARVTLRGTLPAATPGPGATFFDYLPATAPLAVCLPAAIHAHLERFAPPETLAAWTRQLAGNRPQLLLVPPSEDLAVTENVGATLLEKGAPQTPSQNVCCFLRSSQDALGQLAPTGMTEERPANSAKEAKRFGGGLGNRLSSKGGSQPPVPDEPVEAASLRGLFGADLGALGPGAEPWRRRETGDLLRRWQADGFRLVAFASTPGDADRLRDLFAEAEPFQGLKLALHQAPLGAGIWLPGPKLVFLADHELLGRHPVPPAGRAGLFHTAPPGGDDTPELEEGAAAVHAAHGICLFHGIREVETAGRRQEALELEFADRERLFVPLDQIHLVSRYVGGTRLAPKLSRLRGVAWRHARDAAAGSAMDLAAELLRIAACREHAKGHAFPDQGSWEHSFAQAFPYAETPDQARAIADVLADLAAAKPMDRLLCGDAGYGKTEVAMRAAFRAVLAGKQVAVLVPTTVLAQQHERTFRERLAEYPVRIEMLSRFRTPGEQKKILAAAAAGTVDILIGTHRLLQPDVAFADLGLVVIDEEQRFGVEHKERFKFLRGNIDVLTMTATPIPRTLYFGLAGLRHLSTIVTPPVDRLPVSTIIAHDEDALVREALQRELDRGGQAFFLHNRVQTIGRAAERLHRLLPDARLAVGHGQMPGGELEEVMTRFVNGEADILV
ncbi:MAG: DEAD/DEAH box helicase, partial [Lentisphaeria bacterium]